MTKPTRAQLKSAYGPLMQANIDKYPEHKQELQRALRKAIRRTVEQYKPTQKVSVETAMQMRIEWYTEQVLGGEFHD